jgi:hypothetical protein
MANRCGTQGFDEVPETGFIPEKILHEKTRAGFSMHAFI